VRSLHISPSAEVQKKLELAKIQVGDKFKNNCYHCGTVNEKALKKCGKCARARYCSRECQVEDWAMGHKVLCLPLKNSEI
jgi:hypothetical protein